MNTVVIDAGDSLAAIQARMQAHVLAADVAGEVAGDVAQEPAGVATRGAGALADVLASDTFSAARRLGIYHHAYRARLLETLRDTFAHTLSYLGDAWFDHLARAYIEQHPSRHANLRWYGDTWPDWLAGDRLLEAGAGEHPEVAELARLDWSLRRAFDAADQPVATLADLAVVPAEAWAEVTLKAQPCVAVLSLQHNTLSLWHALDQGGEVPEAQALPAPMGVLVWRQDERPHFRSVSPPEDVALTGMLLGRPFGSLCALLAERFPDNDVAMLASSLLRRWIDDGLLMPITAPTQDEREERDAST